MPCFPVHNSTSFVVSQLRQWKNDKHTHTLMHAHAQPFDLARSIIDSHAWLKWKGFPAHNIIKNLFILFHPLFLSSCALPVLPLVLLPPSIILSPPGPPDSITSINLFLWLQCLCSVDDLSLCVCVLPAAHTLSVFGLLCVCLCLLMCTLHSFGVLLFSALLLCCSFPFCVYCICFMLPLLKHTAV